jgi:hypothetical protein
MDVHTCIFHAMFEYSPQIKNTLATFEKGLGIVYSIAINSSGHSLHGQSYTPTPSPLLLQTYIADKNTEPSSDNLGVFSMIISL